MDAAPRAITGDRAADPRVAERFAALDRVKRAQRALELERGRAAAPIDDGAPDHPNHPDHDPAEIEHLLDIHRALEQERRVARRPFARRNGREILSLELAERLVLDRLGHLDFASYEATPVVAHTDDPIIDLVELSRLESELSSALADLARLRVGGNDEPTTPLPRRKRRPASVLPMRPGGRATSTRKQVFGSASGWAPDHRRRAADLAPGPTAAEVRTDPQPD